MTGNAKPRATMAVGLFPPARRLSATRARLRMRVVAHATRMATLAANSAFGETSHAVSAEKSHKTLVQLLRL